MAIGKRVEAKSVAALAGVIVDSSQPSAVPLVLTVAGGTGDSGAAVLAGEHRFTWQRLRQIL